MIKITDRTRSLGAFRLAEVEELLEKFIGKIGRLRQVENTDLVVKGEKNPAGKTFGYAVDLVVRFNRWRTFRVEAAEGEIRPTVQEAINRIKKLVRRMRRDELP